MVGHCPFNLQYEQEMLKKQIISGVFDKDNEKWNELSSDGKKLINIFLAKDLIEKLLVVDPQGRLTAEKMLEHPFFK